MDIQIKYNNGSMVVHLQEFMGCRNISKVKKLVKLIRSSHTPECEKKVREYVEQEIEQFESRQAEHIRRIRFYSDSIEFHQKQIDNSTENRDRYTRGTDGWKHFNNEIQHFRQAVREDKALLRTWKSAYNSNIKNHDFCEKVLEIVA